MLGNIRVRSKDMNLCNRTLCLWMFSVSTLIKILLGVTSSAVTKYSQQIYGYQSKIISVFYCTDSPVNVTVEVSHAGPLAVGSSVNLTCTSAANPEANSYTWYSSRSLLQGASDKVLSLTSLEVSHSGLYLCQAGNHVGENNSSAVLLAVEETKSECVSRASQPLWFETQTIGQLDLYVNQ